MDAVCGAPVQNMKQIDVRHSTAQWGSTKTAVPLIKCMLKMCIINLWRIASSGMLCRVALVRTNVSEELSAPIIRVTGIGELGTALAIASNRCMLLIPGCYFPECWVGRAGQIPCSSYLPDIMLLNILLCGYVKDTVYETLPALNWSSEFLLRWKQSHHKNWRTLKGQLNPAQTSDML
jgi:hypothetical protein